VSVFASIFSLLIPCSTWNKTCRLFSIRTFCTVINCDILKANLEDADRNQLIGKLHEILSLDGGAIDHVDLIPAAEFALIVTTT